MPFTRGKTITRFSCLAGTTVLFALVAGCGPKPPNLMGVLMVAGDQDDERGLALSRLAERLTGRGEVRVNVARDLSTLEDPGLARHRVLVFGASAYGELSPATQEAVLAHVRSGGGLVAINGALSAFAAWPEWTELVGGVSIGYDGNAPRECAALDPEHAVVMGMGGRFLLPDAPGLIDRLDPAAEVLARSAQLQPQIWTKPAGDGRVVAIAFGRDPRALEDEWFITLLHQAVRWAGRDLPDTSHNTLTTAERQEGYELLFNGQDLSGWTGQAAHWTVENGELVGRADKLPADAFLFGADEYGDFLLRCSVRLRDGQGNSGIIFRCGRPSKGAVRGYRADIAAGRFGTISAEGGTRGVLVDGWTGKGEFVAVPDGWNDLAVRATGRRIVVALNGLTTAVYAAPDDDPEPPAGPIALKLPRNTPLEVRFRDIRIQRLDQSYGRVGPPNVNR